MKYIFWIAWILDAGVAIWWVFSEIQLDLLKPNPYALLFFLYVIICFLCYQVFKLTKLALILSLIPAVPFVIMGIIVLIAILTGARWN